MKIGIVSAHYMPEIGYQEVHLAKAYARLGHTVKVFTSAASVKLGGKISELKYVTGLTTDPKYGYEIVRLPSISYKSKAIPFGLKKAVNAFEPQLLVILGVAKIFPMALLNNYFHHKFKIITVYGDAREYLDRTTISQNIKTSIHELGYTLIKYPLYRRAIKYGDKLILNIPETNELFQHFLSKKDKPEFEQKKVMLNLGYDPDEYYYNEADRTEIRKELGFKNNEVIIITSTRINKRKNLEQIIEFINTLNEQGKSVSYILVGFLGDAYEQELKAFILDKKHADKFKCYAFLNSKEIRKLYCAADAGIWIKAAISIQEAMGTGLPIILEDKPSVNHLIEEGKTGWFFNEKSFTATIQKAVVSLSEKKFNREELAMHNSKRLSYDAIANKILDTLSI